LGAACDFQKSGFNLLVVQHTSDCGVVFQMLIVVASWMVAKSVFNQSDLQNDIQTVLKVSVE